MKYLGFVALLFFASLSYATEIRFTDSQSNQHSVSLDNKKVPRVDQDATTQPTIKDFREGGENSSICYVSTSEVGTKKKSDETALLLKALVKAADGDGDSFATLKSIKRDKNGLYTVVVNVSDESGEKDEEFLFPPCAAI